ncbi:hypothetical protein SAMN05444161_9389 [Rhizobiales bacterium GAS191]|nr:hypothetical protein SAMN05444161_9389 [Rhizobiales bacterium GAS191]
MEEPRRKTHKFSDFAMNTDRDLSVFETKVIQPPNEGPPVADGGTPSPATARQEPELTKPTAGLEAAATPSSVRKASPPTQSAVPSERAAPAEQPEPDKGESIAISARIPADVYLSMRRATRLREKQNDFIISALKREIASRE